MRMLVQKGFQTTVQRRPEGISGKANLGFTDCNPFDGISGWIV